MDSCHAGVFEALWALDPCLLGGEAGCDPGTAGRPYFEYVQSCTRPRKPEKTSARVRIAIPVAYAYTSFVALDCDVGLEAESVVMMTPKVTTITEITWVMLKLGGTEMETYR